MEHFISYLQRMKVAQKGSEKRGKKKKIMGRKEREEKALNEAELIRVSKGCFRCLNPQLRAKRDKW